jgi:glucokinase
MSLPDLDDLGPLTGDPSNFALVGDVGGTNARFALIDLSRDPTRLCRATSLKCADYATPGDAITEYLARIGFGRWPAFAVIAAAGPVNDGEIAMTNLNWTLSEDDLRSRGSLSVRLINDYAAAALAAPLLDFQDAPSLGGPAAGQENRTLAVLGAGTGFGVSALARDGFGETVLATEGGHVAFAPSDHVEIDVLRILTLRFGRVSIERILSGEGLCDLHQALGEIAGRATDAFTDPADITRAGLAGDPDAARTLDRFCAILGSVAGDVALGFGAKGGVFISGGIAPVILDHLMASEFRARFESKGRFEDYLREIPTRVIVRPHAALLGAADALRRLLRAGHGRREATA